MEDVLCICGGSKAILSKLLSVVTLLCGRGVAAGEGKGVHPDLVASVSSTTTNTTMQQEAATLAQNKASLEAVSQKLEAVLQAANTRTGRAAAPTCAAFIVLVKQRRFCSAVESPCLF